MFRVWIVLLAACELFYSLTGLAVPMVLVAASPAFWNDFRTAYWLKRVDHDPGRGRASRWVFINAGVLKTALSLTAAFIVLVALFGRTEREWEQRPGYVDGVALALTGCLLVVYPALAICTGATLISGLRLPGLKLYYSGLIHEARRQNDWPGEVFSKDRFNRLGLVLKPSLCLTLVFVSMMLLLFIVITSSHLGILPGNDPSKAGGSVLFALLSWGAVSIYFIRLYQGICNSIDRVKADSPQVCWGYPNDLLV